MRRNKRSNRPRNYYYYGVGTNKQYVGTRVYESICTERIKNEIKRISCFE